MIKIIQKGNLKRIQCRSCGCLFEYEYSDIEHIPGMTCMNRGTNIVCCPQCKKKLDVNNGYAVNCFGYLER